MTAIESRRRADDGKFRQSIEAREERPSPWKRTCSRSLLARSRRATAPWYLNENALQFTSILKILNVHVPIGFR